MANKKLSEMTEEELLQLVKKYYDEMDYIMTEEDDEEACEKVYKKYIKAYEQLLVLNIYELLEKERLD